MVLHAGLGGKDNADLENVARLREKLNWLRRNGWGGGGWSSENRRQVDSFREGAQRGANLVTEEGGGRKHEMMEDATGDRL